MPGRREARQRRTRQARVAYFRLAALDSLRHVSRIRPMSKLSLVILGAIVIAAIAIPAAIQHQFQARLSRENGLLEQRVAQMNRLSADNQRLSNLVAQAKAALASSDDQFQELLKLRAEVTRLTQANQELNRANQAKVAQSATDQLRELSALRKDVGGLSQVIGNLRDEMREFHAAAAIPPVAEKPAAQPATADEQPSPIRMIDTHGATFADKLKKSVGAQDGETFQEVFGRYLQINGVDTSSVAGLYFDERTGRVIARGPALTLDQIEKVTVALDRAQ